MRKVGKHAAATVKNDADKKKLADVKKENKLLKEENKNLKAEIERLQEEKRTLLEAAGAGEDKK